MQRLKYQISNNFFILNNIDLIIIIIFATSFKINSLEFHLFLNITWYGFFVYLTNHALLLLLF